MLRHRHTRTAIFVALAALVLATLAMCGQVSGQARPDANWGIAIHGGAGTIPKTLPESEKQQYLRSLGEALKVGQEVLRQGGTSLDAVEKVVRFLEDDPLFNAGRGAVYTHEGTHELDAAIMVGRTKRAGSVAPA